VVEVCKKFRFEAAHWLPGFPEGHKCRRLHGHSFEVEVYVAGPVDAHTGIVMDYGDIKKLVGPLVEQLDHYCLNDVGNTLNDPLLQNPTSENLARWFYREVKELIPQLSHIVVHETCTSLCIYRGQ
jgi:6-pyruvoyltetrahydropterin/6-carboxytetrahydropterin synthase